MTPITATSHARSYVQYERANEMRHARIYDELERSATIQHDAVQEFRLERYDQTGLTIWKEAATSFQLFM